MRNGLRIRRLPSAHKEAYRQHVEAAAAVFREHGALRMVECWGDDVPHGKRTDFYRAVEAQADETVVFSWVEWPSKAVRDEGMAKIMADPRLQPDTNPMPFDATRLIYGGFVPVLDNGGMTPLPPAGRGVSGRSTAGTSRPG